MNQTHFIWDSHKPNCTEIVGLIEQHSGRWAIAYSIDGDCEEGGFTVEQIAEIGKALVAWSEGQA